MCAKRVNQNIDKILPILLQKQVQHRLWKACPFPHYYPPMLRL